MLKNEKIQALFRSEIDRVSVDLASYETLKEFRLIKEPFTLESGELTPSLKIKRNVVEKRYADIIESMYQENA
ncbi:MAG TPA: hypothetical protein ENK14_05140 [Caldithrix sp.]|nr:hypothetical protein [Caldithrix sp.]